LAANDGDAYLLTQKNMRSLNRVMFIGHLAAEPETRQTKNGHTVVNFPIAINRISRDKDGSKKEAVDFHRILAWNKLGNICGEYLHKGQAIFVEGRLVNHSFDDNDGKKHFRTEIVAEGLNILTWKKTKSGSAEIGIEDVVQKEEEEELVAA
jgi:single-strand DNA-binding protein